MSILECDKKQLASGHVVYVVRVFGGICPGNEDILYQKIAEMINEGAYFFVMNFAGIDYINSTHLGFLLGLIFDGIQVKIVKFPKKLLTLWEILGINSLIENQLYEAEEQAIESFHCSRAR